MYKSKIRIFIRNKKVYNLKNLKKKPRFLKLTLLLEFYNVFKQKYFYNEKT